MNDDLIVIYWQPLVAALAALIGVVVFFLKRTLNNLEENQNKTVTVIGQKIDSMAEKIDKQIEKLENDQSRLEKEFYDFKENVAKNYTKQDDFSSQTRDINNKLDNISASMNKIMGKLDNKGVS